MSTILLRNILNEFEDLPDEIKEKYGESLQNIKSQIKDIITSMKSTHSLSKSISTSNLTSKSNVFSAPQQDISLESQLDELKSEMLNTIKRNKNAISLDHKEMI